MSAEELALLREMREELRAVRAAVDRLTPVAPPSIDSKTTDLLRVLWAIFRDRNFTSRELITHGSVDLQAAIVAAVGSLNAIRLGRRLEKVMKSDSGEIKVTCLCEIREGALWSLSKRGSRGSSSPPS